MRTMISLTFWYMWRSFVNALKRHWKMFLGIILFFALLVGIVLAVNYFSDNKNDTAQEQEQTGDNEGGVTAIGDTLIIERENDFLVIEGDNQYEVGGVFFVEAIVLIVVLLMVAIGIRSGAKNGVNIFTMADVNFLFPSPNKPQNVLMFKMLAQIGATLIGSIYILFQMFNYIGNGFLTVPAAIFIFLGFFVLSVSSNYFGIFAYLILEKKPAIKGIVAKYIMFVVALPVVVVIALKYIFGLGLFEAIYQAISSTWSRLIPFVGWLKWYVVAAVQGKYLVALGLLTLTILFMALLVKVTWSIKADFYEDSLTFATMQQEAIQKVNEKTRGAMDYSKKHDKKSDAKRWDRRRNNSIVFAGYEGAKVFFAKTMLNRKRMFRLGGLLSSEFVGTLAYGAGLAIGYEFLKTSGIPIETFLMAYLMIIVVGLFFRSFTNPIQLDLNVNFIYMIPEKPMPIVCWSMLGHFVNGAIDMLPVLIVSYYFTHSISVMVVAYMTFVVLNAYFGMVALFIEIIIKGYLPKYLSYLIQVILRLLPLGVVVLIVYFGLKNGIITSLVAPFVIFNVVNVIFIVLALIPCALCLHKGRK